MYFVSAVAFLLSSYEAIQGTTYILLSKEVLLSSKSKSKKPFLTLFKLAPEYPSLFLDDPRNGFSLVAPTCTAVILLYQID